MIVGLVIRGLKVPRQHGDMDIDITSTSPRHFNVLTSSSSIQGSDSHGDE